MAVMSNSKYLNIINMSDLTKEKQLCTLVIKKKTQITKEISYKKIKLKIKSKLLL